MKKKEIQSDLLLFSKARYYTKWHFADRTRVTLCSSSALHFTSISSKPHIRVK